MNHPIAVKKSYLQRQPEIVDRSIMRKFDDAALSTAPLPPLESSDGNG